MSKQQDIPRLVEQCFPAPSFRENQKEVIVDAVVSLYYDDYDVVLVDAPTGFGKSITLYTIMDVIEELQGSSAYYTTPLKILQDQLTNDDFVGDDVVEIKGRNNYDCILPDADPGTTVDEAKCQRDSDFDCDLKGECPYYEQKERAKQHSKTVMNTSYMMAESMVPETAENKFGHRYLGVLDECQSLEDWAENFISLTVSERNVPDRVWNSITLPDERKVNELDEIVSWLREDVVQKVYEMIQYLDSKAVLGKSEHSEKEKLEKFANSIDRFLDDVENHNWKYDFQPDIRKNAKNRTKIVMKPVRYGRFLDSLVWDRFDKVILSSATIPTGDWLDWIGLSDAKSKRISVGSEFPIENRPIITEHTVGKMTKSERDKNKGDMFEKIKQIADHHEGEKGIVHCRGYNYAKMFRRYAYNNGHRRWFENNVVMQDRSDREQSLEDWKEGDTQVFFSVNMAEGIDLEGDLCRWQVLAKVLYPFMGDERVSHIVKNEGNWDWYNRQAAIQMEQAYGRAVRSKSDSAIFYVLDSSAKKLIRMNAELFHTWFLEAIDDMYIDPSRGV